MRSIRVRTRALDQHAQRNIGISIGRAGDVDRLSRDAWAQVGQQQHAGRVGSGYRRPDKIDLAWRKIVAQSGGEATPGEATFHSARNRLMTPHARCMVGGRFVRRGGTNVPVGNPGGV